MACPFCGDHCTCTPVTSGNGAHTAVLIDPETNDYSEAAFEASLADERPAVDLATEPAIDDDILGIERAAAEPAAAMMPAAEAPAEVSFYRPEEPNEWRQEVTSRVDAFRQKRRRRYDPDSSLSLNFESSAAPAFPPRSVEPPAPYRMEAEEGPAKIIEFPKLNIAPERPVLPPLVAEELPEPILESPRILVADDEPAVEDLAGEEADGEAILASSSSREEEYLQEEPVWREPSEPELAEPVYVAPAPALEAELPLAAASSVSDLHAIVLDTDDPRHDEIGSAAFELPLPVAPLGQRTYAMLIDGVVVLAATAAFAMVVSALTGIGLGSKLGGMLFVIAPATFWTFYNFSFLTYLGFTPGMDLAGLRLCHFGGGEPLRSQLCIRSLAMSLSAAALGLGFLWAFLDEDNLSWHDRITHTFMATDDAA